MEENVMMSLEKGSSMSRISSILRFISCLASTSFISSRSSDSCTMPFWSRSTCRNFSMNFCRKFSWLFSWKSRIIWVRAAHLLEPGELDPLLLLLLRHLLALFAGQAAAGSGRGYSLASEAPRVSCALTLSSMTLASSLEYMYLTISCTSSSLR